MTTTKPFAHRRRMIPGGWFLSIMLLGCCSVGTARAQDEFYVVKAQSEACKIVTLPPTTTDEKLLAGGQVFSTRDEAAAQLAALADCGGRDTQKDTNVGQATPAPRAVAKVRSHPRRVRSAKQQPARRAPGAEVSAAGNRSMFWFGGNW